MAGRPTPPRRRRSPIEVLVGAFARGLLFVVPIAATVYAVWFVFVEVDTWINVEPLLDRRVPGAGIVLTVVLITLVGFLAGNIATRWLFRWLENVLVRTPLVKLLYGSVKDLIGAFVGEKKSFDRPVLVRLGSAPDVETVGFVTRDAGPGLDPEGRVAVYLPQAYNFGGVVVLVPRSRVRALDAEPSAVMAFVMSGGISGDMGSGAKPAGLIGPS